jgi:hypothetical protein
VTSAEYAPMDHRVPPWDKKYTRNMAAFAVRFRLYQWKENSSLRASSNTRRLPMKRAIARTTFLVAFAAVFAVGFQSRAQAQTNSTQVVFSDTGASLTLTGNSKVPPSPNNTTPFGFWLWCDAGAPSGSNGTYLGACNGSMYFYALQTQATSIVGFVTESTDSNEVKHYTMNVFQGTFADFLHGKLNPAFVCTLTNMTTPTPGATNTVQVNCTFANSLGDGTGSLTDTGAVVNITGPSN